MAGRPSANCQLPTAFSIPQQIRNLDKELPSIVQEAILRAKQVSVRVELKRPVEVLQVAVVADVDGCPRMQEVSQQDVRVKALRGLQRGQLRVREHRAVLPDDAQRQFARELVVPLRADNVVVENVRVRELIAQPGEQIGIVDRQPAKWLNGRHDLSIAGFREHGRTDRGIVIRVGAEADFPLRTQLLEEVGKEEAARVVVSIVFVRGKRVEVHRAQPLVPEVAEAAEVGLSTEHEAVIRVGEPFQARSAVVPVVDREQRRSMPQQVFALRTKTVLREVAEAANVRPPKESGVGLEICGRVLIKRVELHPS